MTLGLYDSDRRYRRRVWTKFTKFALFAALLLGVGLFAYQMGIEQLKGREADSRDKISALQRQVSELQLLVSQFQNAARTAEGRAGDMEARYARDIPTGELARLSKLLSERLAAGIDSNRLAHIINAAQNNRSCQPPENKRFVLPTPIYKGPTRSTSFANGALTVTGEGQSSRDANGNAEGWYDPTQPVKIRVTAIGGRESVATGVLPLHHSVVVDNTEYRFSFTAGTRSFVDIMADRCAYP